MNKISFENWANRKKVPEHHRKGMLAFLGLLAQERYTLEEWDALFVAY